MGRSPDEMLLIVVSDGLGMSNAANRGVSAALTTGLATSAELLVPCPWARAAAADYHGEDIGVSLTFLAQYDRYRWGPITNAPSLLDGDGGFPRTANDLGEHADIDEVRREARAQLERAVLWGFDPTHLSSHFDALCLRPELFDVYLELAIEFRLPLSIPHAGIDLGFPARDLAADEGIMVADRVVSVPWGRESRPAVDQAIGSLEPGITEIRVRPAIDSPELRAISPTWSAHVSDAHLVTDDWSVRAALARSGAELIGYMELRAAQRAGDRAS
jgi:predicted glycoside hydrolase/deacetylase ChbG (UPF0249 family)